MGFRPSSQRFWWLTSSKRDHFSTRWSPEVTSKPDFSGVSDIFISIVELLLSHNRGNTRQIQGGFPSLAFRIVAFFMSCTNQRVLPLPSSLLLPALLHPQLLPRERKAVPLPRYSAEVLPNDLKHLLLPGVSVPPHPRLVQLSQVTRSRFGSLPLDAIYLSLSNTAASSILCEGTWLWLRTLAGGGTGCPHTF